MRGGDTVTIPWFSELSDGARSEAHGCPRRSKATQQRRGVAVAVRNDPSYEAPGAAQAIPCQVNQMLVVSISVGVMSARLAVV